ncbi:roadblock/LC7 domain-containing protein [Streptomyces sp. NBC_01320]|uniref:roadblock/LC7 domain-containing protein n=1 Tax=Streptomyces sp. NBC_01320 TaxID=2903824 RepID=UPI002E106EC8|nr:roadblock/LC7 domain-containing protein [Streptomyces sp. NBC_01320]
MNSSDMHLGPSSSLSQDAENFNWLLSRFAGNTAGVRDAIAVSSDGLMIAQCIEGERADVDRLAAIVAGMTSLAGGVAGSYQLGSLNKVIVDMNDGYLLISAIGCGSVMGVIASKQANLGQVAYEMTLFANRAGAALTPELIRELKNHIQA